VDGFTLWYREGFGRQRQCQEDYQGGKTTWKGKFYGKANREDFIGKTNGED
jgi:hypothetical protein